MTCLHLNIQDYIFWLHLDKQDSITKLHLDIHNFITWLHLDIQDSISKLHLDIQDSFTWLHLDIQLKQTYIYISQRSHDLQYFIIMCCDTHVSMFLISFGFMIFHCVYFFITPDNNEISWFVMNYMYIYLW